MDWKTVPPAKIYGTCLGWRAFHSFYVAATSCNAASWAVFLSQMARKVVFAIGDVRSGNVKRAASAVGKGGIAVHLVHGALADL